MPQVQVLSPRPYRVFITNLSVGNGHSISFCLYFIDFLYVVSRFGSMSIVGVNPKKEKCDKASDGIKLSLVFTFVKRIYVKYDYENV